MKKLLPLAIAIASSGCGYMFEETPDSPAVAQSNEPAAQATTVPSTTPPDQQPAVTLPNNTANPVPTVPEPVPGTSTGSVDPLLLAQWGSPRGRSMPAAPTIEFRGLDTTDTVSLDLPRPPHDLTLCNNAIILGNNIPVMAENYQFNSWWLLASTSYTVSWKSDGKTYLYWAKQISEDEVGAVPLPEYYSVQSLGNKQIATNFAQLPYQWFSPITGFMAVPANPEEPCEK